jgi:sulfate permease, SulP family
MNNEFKPKLFTTLKSYSRDQLYKDIGAGIVVAIIALPLSIALAISSGVTPEKGLITAIIAGFVTSLLGGSRVQIGGPTGAFMIIVYGIVAQYGLDGLIISTVMAGFIMMLFGFFRLGSVIKFIPYPITTGFISGIAVVIFVSQLKDFFGLKTGELPVEFLDKCKIYMETFKTIDPESTLIAVIALAVIIFWPRVSKKIPGSLVALIVTTLAVFLLKLDVETIGSKFGSISSAIPLPSLPGGISIDKIRSLITPAITIAILGSIESLLSAVVSDGMIGGKHRSNMELVAQGAANIASGLFGGIPATGAVARTVANIKNGARTPVAGMVHSVALLAIMIFLMPLASLIPLPALAAILVMVAYNMSEWREFKALFSTPKSDVIVLLITFLITVFFDLVKAIQIGMILAALLFMKRMASVMSVNKIRIDSSEDEEPVEKTVPKNVQVYEINGPFFFGAADKFIDTFKEIDHTTHIIILRLRHVPVLDATALRALRTFLEVCRKRHIVVLITGLNAQPMKVLQNSGLYDAIGSRNFYNELDDAVEYAKQILGLLCKKQNETKLLDK